MSKLEIRQVGVTATPITDEANATEVLSIDPCSSTHPMAMQLARERMLSHALGIEVTIDRTGWTRGRPEVVIHRNEDGSIHPLRVKMSPKTQDEEILGSHSIAEYFTEYNRLMGALQQLQARAAIQVARLSAPEDSAITRVHRDLAQLPDLIARRQARTMGNRTVGLDALHRELEFMRSWHMALTHVVVDAEERERRHIPAFIKRLVGFVTRGKNDDQLD